MYTTKNETHGAIMPDTSQTPANVFLFIGNKLRGGTSYHNYFSHSFIAENFAEAKAQLSTTPLPELILIDLPYHSAEFAEFKKWLTVQKLNIPVIYNESSLKKEQAQQLFQKKMVDDVVDFQKNYVQLANKASFIRKIHINNSFKKNNKKTANHTRSFNLIRGIDILVSLIGILICSPLFVLIAIAIKLESKGPVFYSSLRAGRGFKIFKFYKFRTMIVDADKKIDELANLNLYSSGPSKANFFKIKDDPRITRIGLFLRNSSLDELPQLFNVLKGDMSIVGNRPLPLYEASTLTTNEWAERFMAPAGITGLWQISKRGKAEMSTEERILIDINYARNRSLKGDLKILMQTPTALIQKTNV